MPTWYDGNQFSGLIFDSGERGLYKPDEKSKAMLCEVKRMLKDARNVPIGYEIILPDGEEKNCTLKELRPIQ